MEGDEPVFLGRFNEERALNCDGVRRQEAGDVAVLFERYDE
jgi:hypothetical protein